MSLPYDMSCTGVTYEANERSRPKKKTSQMKCARAPYGTSIDSCAKSLIPVKRITEFANMAFPPSVSPVQVGFASLDRQHDSIN